MRACGARHLQRINCPRLPGDREPHRGCAGSYFTIKETNHAIRCYDSFGRAGRGRVRAADGAGVERQENPRHVNAGKGTRDCLTPSAAHVIRAENKPTRPRKGPSISEAARVGRFINNRKGTGK